MDNSFKDKVVLISGSTRGIGKTIAKHFAEREARVIITGRASETVDRVVKEFLDENLKADGFPCSVSDADLCRDLVQKVVDKHKGIDILVNNAGLTRDNLLLRMSEKEWDDVLSTNLKGAFHLTKLVSKQMLRRKQGKIINISSIIGMTGNTGQSNYAASKAGLIGFTKSVALEFASRGIQANAIAPGYIDTDMSAQLNQDSKDQILNQIPLKRFGSADDIAAVCLFLASHSADYITGQTIVVDGGIAI